MSVAKVKDDFIAISRYLLCCYSNDVNGNVRSWMSTCNLSRLKITAATSKYRCRTDALTHSLTSRPSSMTVGDCR